MTGWLKSTAGKLLKTLHRAGSRHQKKAPGPKPKETGVTDSFSVGIHFEALEPRILLSGSGEAGLADNALQNSSELSQNAIEMESFAFHEPSSHSETDSLNLINIPEESSSGSPTNSVQGTTQESFTTGDLPGSTSLVETGATPSANELLTDDLTGDNVDTLTALDTLQQDMAESVKRHELILVDAGAADHQQLVDDLLANPDEERHIEVFVLDSDRDGVAQISELLAEYRNLDAVHIVSHGTDRAVKLGSAWVYGDNLNGYGTEIAGWKDSLADGADLLFYGCDLAGGEEGRVLLDAFGLLTGADVAASVDDTGHSQFGGDWDLEYTTGPIEATLPLSAALQENWNGLLNTFTVTNTNSGGLGSLRRAINDANGLAGPDTIQFNIPLNDPNHVYYQDDGIAGSLSVIATTTLADGAIADFDPDYPGTPFSWYTIQLVNALPAITGRVVLDGTSQLAFDGRSGLENPVIELDGSMAGGADPNGLTLEAGNSEVRGLAINRFADDGIEIEFGNLNRIAGNHIGTDVTGTIALGNVWGINIKTAGNVIGGTTAADRNVISGNTGEGVYIFTETAQDNTIIGNYIGTDAAGTGTLGNGSHGIYFAEFPFESPDNNTIGGINPGEGNIIAFNNGSGVALFPTTGIGNAIIGNSIHSNQNLGIDLGENGITANDPGDSDSGANGLQNYPVIASALTDGLKITVNGTINSTASTTFRIEFFDSSVEDGTGYGEGETYLGFTTVDTDAAGDAAFRTTFSAAVPAGHFITATATSPGGNTSEFAANADVLAGDSDGDGLWDVEEDANTDLDGDPSTNSGPDTDGDTFVNYLDGQPDYLDGPTGGSSGMVASEQKISSTTGGLNATLDDDDNFGAAVAAIGDLDGDGVVDIAVGAKLDDDGGTDRGAVHILFLNADGTVKAEQKISNTTGGLTGVLNDGDHFGCDVTGIGDLDGDGINDIAVGANYDDDGGTDHGAVYVLFLNADGTVKAEQKISNTTGGLTATLDLGDWFGRAVTGMGDLDGDGLNDIAVTAVRDDDGGSNRGAVHILFLNADGTVKAEQKISDTTGGLTTTLGNNNWFGAGVGSIGDLDGDGTSDIVVGASQDDDGGGNSGAVYVLFLNADGTVKAEQNISNTTGGLTATLDVGDLFGVAVAGLGDLNADGTSDIAVGVERDDDPLSVSDIADRGAVHILFLNPDGTVKAEQKISSTSGGLTGPLDDSDWFGKSLAGLGDLNGDGTIDIVVGAEQDDDGGADRGAVHVLKLTSGTPGPPMITGRETVDSDTDGQIDRIRITTTEALNDDFLDLNVTVEGYTVTGYSTDIANDNIFYVDLVESGTPDTGATPTVTLTANTFLGDADGNSIAVDNNWLDANWQSRARLTFDNTDQTTDDLVDFPLLVTIDKSKLPSLDLSSTVGADVRFTDAVTGQELKYEVQSWDAAADTAKIWVKVPRIDAGSATEHIYVYYNYNGTATYDQSAADEAAVWPSGTGVYHLEDDPGPGNPGDIKDADGTPNNGEAASGFATNDLVPGQIGDGIEWESGDDVITFGSADVGDNFRISAWVNPADNGELHTVVSNAGPGNNTDGFRFYISSTGQITLSTGNGAAGNAATSVDGAVNFGQWNHIAVDVDRTSGSAVIYHNGEDVTADGTILTDFNTSSDWVIGTMKGSLNQGNNFLGIIDEVRIGNATQSADWAKVEYLTQSGTFAFTSFASEEAVTAGVTAIDGAAPVLLSANGLDGGTPGLLNDTGDQLALVFSEAVQAAPSETDSETNFILSGTDGDNFPTEVGGDTVIGLSTTTVINDTIRYGFSAGDTANANLITPGTSTIDVNVGGVVASSIQDAAGNDLVDTLTGDPITITNAGGNDAPTVDLDTGTGGVDYAFTFNEGDGPTAIVDATVSVADVDDTSLVNVTLDVGGVVDGAAEELSIGDFTFALDADNSDTTVTIGGNLYTVAYTTASGVATTTITVTDANDAPVVAAPGAALNATEQTGLAIHGAGFSVSDVDEAGSGAQATLSVGEGTITVVAGTSGVTIAGGNGTGTVTVTGTIAQINNLLTGAGTGTITYLNSSDTPSPSTTLTVTVNDLGNTGADPGTSGTATTEEGTNNVTINIGAVNDAPVVAAPGAALNATEQTGLAIHGTGFSVSDVDEAGSGAQATLSVGEGALTVVAGTSGVTISGGNGTGTVTLTGTIAYLNSSDAPSASTTLTVTVNDQGNTGTDPGTSGTATTEEGTNNVTINITAVNDPPALNLDADNSSGAGGNDYQFTFSEGDVARAIADSDVDVADVDSTSFDYVTLSISGLQDGNAEELVLDGSTFALATAANQDTSGMNYHVVITTGSGTADVTITKQSGTPFTEAETETLLAAVAYRHADGTNPSDGDRIIDLTVNDGTDDSPVARTTINVDPVNDGPTLSSALGYGVNEDDGYIPFGGLGVADPDSGANPISVTLSVGNGFINLTNRTGLTLAGGGYHTDTFTVTGTVADIDNALGSFQYRPTPNFFGNDTLSLSADNLGNTGTGGSETDSRSANIAVAAVNDAPSATNLDAAETYTEDTALDLTDIVVTDIDSANVTVTLTLSDPLAGSLSTGTSGSVTSTYDSGTGQWEASGAIADVNALLASVIFTPTSEYNSNFTIATSVDDGQAPPVTGTKNVAGTPDNDPPVHTVPPPQSTPQNTSLVFSSGTSNPISVSDLDAGSGIIEVTLTATNGTITVTGAAGDPISVTATGSQQEFGADIARAADGSMVMVWANDGKDGDSWGVYGQRYDSSGEPVGIEFRVNNTTAKEQLEPAVAMDDAGNFVVVWQSLDQTGDPSYGIYARLYDSSGTAQGPEFRINQTTNDAQASPDVAMDADGDFVVVWESKDQTGDPGLGVYARRYNSLGTAQGNEFRVAQTTANDQSEPSVAVADGGEFVVTWTSDDAGGKGVYARLYDAGGTAVTGETPVNSYSANDQTTSRAAMNGVGNFVVTWQSKDQDGDSWGVYAQRFNSLGVAQGGEIPVTAYTTSDQQAPDVAMSSAGNFVIAWESMAQDGNNWGVYKQEFDAAGVKVGGETRVNIATSGPQYGPRIGMTGGGDYIVVYNGDSPGDSDGVAAQRFLSTSGIVFTNGDGNEDVTMTFTGTLAEINDALDGLTFKPNASYIGPATLRIVTNDQGNTGGPAETDDDTIDIDVIDSGAPEIDLDADDSSGQSGPNFVATFTEDAGPVNIVDADVTITDVPPPTPNLESLTVRLTNQLDGADEELTADTIGTFITANWNSGLGRLFLSGTDSLANYEKVLRTITYNNTSQYPDTTPRIITFVGNDGIANTNTATTTVTIVGVNDPPAIAGTSTNPTATESGTGTAPVALIQAGTGGITDVDAPNFAGGTITVNLDVYQPGDRLSVSGSPSGVGSVSGGDGADLVITLDAGATPAAVGTILEALRYENTGDDPTVVGTDTDRTYSIILNDGGNSPAPALDSNTLTGTVTVVGENDAPINTVPGPQTTNEDTSLVFSSGTGNPISIGDSDAGTNIVEVTLTSTNGTLTLDGLAAAWGPETTLNTSPVVDPFTQEFSTYSARQTVAMDADGDYVVVWQSDEGTGLDVYARLFDSTGVVQGPEFRVNTNITDDQQRPVAAMDNDGNFVVVWESWDSGGNEWDIFAQRYDAAGTALGGEIPVNTTVSEYQRRPTIAMDDAGNFVVVWADGDGSTSGWDIYAQRFDASGNKLGQEFLVNTTVTDGQLRPTAAMDRTGNFVITWQSRGQDADDYGVIGRLYDAAGVALTGEFIVNTTETNKQWRPSVAMAESGDFVITWESDQTAVDDWGIFARRYDASGNPIGNKFQVHTNSTRDQQTASIGMAADGEFIITWQSDHPALGDWGVYGQQFAADGSFIGVETMFSTTTSGAQENPSVVMDDGGAFMVVWSGEGVDDSAGVHGQLHTRLQNVSFTTGNGTDDTTITLTGTIADINAALDGMMFTPDLGYFGPASVEITVNDQGHTGSGGPQSYTDTVNITVQGINDAPIVAAPSAPHSATEQIDLAIHGTGFAVKDADEADSGAVATLAVGEGTLTVTPGDSGVSVASGNGTASVVLTGAIADINNLLTAAGTGTIFYNNPSDTPSASTTLTVTVNDQGNTGIDPGRTGTATTEEGSNSVVINITPVNDPPDITSDGGGATAAVNVAENATAVTDVDATDAEGDGITYGLGGGVDDGFFTINTTTGVLSFTAALDFENALDDDGDNVYEVIVTAEDGTDTTTQAITVTVDNVNDNSPDITSNGGGAAAAINVNEGSTGVTTVVATDADGTTPTYSITGGTDSALFTIDGVSGVLTFNTAPDFEAPADSYTNNTYEVIVTATDGTNTDSQTSTVTVDNINDNNPDITSNGGGATAAININEGTTGVTTVVATDADGTTPTYSITGGTDSALFTIDGVSGVLTFNTAPDFEAPADSDTNNTYEVIVTATDGTNTDSQTITVTVDNIDDNTPDITSNGGGATAAININEGTTGVTTVAATDADGTTPTYSITGGTDSALFAIDGVSGVLTFNTAPDFEAPADSDTNNTYEVIVTATDGTNTDSQTITVTVDNINEAPSGTPSITGTATQGQTLTADTSGISDDDGLGAFNYQWQRSFDGGSTWNNVGANASTYLLGATDVGAIVRVEVSYTDGGGTAEGPLTSIATATVTNSNNAPVGTPVITGTATEDQTLTADTSGISDADGLGAFNYQWQRSTDGGTTWANVGANVDIYLLGDADVGAIMRVQVSYMDGGGTAEGPLNSSATAIVGNVNDLPVGVPTITGIITEDQTLTADTSGISDDDGLGAFNYQWQRSVDGGATWTNVGANADTYLLGDADVGGIMRVQVNYTDTHTTAEGPLTSIATATVANVNDAPAGVPTITGIVAEDQTLTADTASISDNDGLGAFNYQWQRSGDGGATWTDVGANAATYLLGDADVGAIMQVQVSYTDAHTTPEGPLTSVATAVVANVNDAPTATNLNASEIYDQNTPLFLTDIFVSDVDSAAVTVTLTLSDLSAGTLSTGTSGAVTSTFAGGVWSASGAIGDVNTLLSNVVFTPTTDYTSDFTIAVSADDGTAPAIAGTKTVTGPVVNDSLTPPPIDPIDEGAPGGENTDPPPEEDPGDPGEEDLTEEDPTDEGTPEDPVTPETAPAGQGGSQAAVASAYRPFSSAATSNLTLAGFESIDLYTLAEFLLSKETSSPEPAAIVEAVEQFFRQRGYDPLSALEFEFLMKSLDELKQETSSEAQFQDIVASSAIAVTSGLSVGYVIWLIRSGVLLSSFLSSMPAWQILDPLPVLSGKRDDDDGESLESILKKGAQNSEKNDKMTHSTFRKREVTG